MFHIGFQYKDTTSQIKAFGVPRKRFGAPTRIVWGSIEWFCVRTELYLWKVASLNLPPKISFAFRFFIRYHHINVYTQKKSFLVVRNNSEGLKVAFSFMFCHWWRFNLWLFFCCCCDSGFETFRSVNTVFQTFAKWRIYNINWPVYSTNLMWSRFWPYIILLIRFVQVFFNSISTFFNRWESGVWRRISRSNFHVYIQRVFETRLNVRWINNFKSENF